MPGRIRTRFAPSPTGLLHVGGARTALFNWLLARGAGGDFLLRIEDTDRQRSTRAAREAILDGMTWLGLDWSGEAVSQSARIERHREVAAALLAAGRAYRCFSGPEEIAAARAAARDAHIPFRFRSPWRDRQDGLPDGPYSVRLRAAGEGETAIEDRVQGRVAWQNRELDDLVLLRSDGSPTYMLAVVVDDHDMEISHVLRGADHLTNAARQSQIYDALDWPRPEFAHVPLIHGPDGRRYSKRHGAVGLDEFRTAGILPEAMRNYLARLGWSHGDEEFFTTEALLQLFSLDNLNRSAARFDQAKLLSLNADHLRQLPDADLIDRLARHLERPDGLPGAGRERLARLLPEFRPRVRTLAELADMAAFLLSDQAPVPDPKASRVLGAEARRLLADLTGALPATTVWEPEGLEAAVRAFAAARGLPLGRVAQPMRAALTGRTASPGIFDVMSVLGRTLALDRLERAATEANAES